MALLAFFILFPYLAYYFNFTTGKTLVDGLIIFVFCIVLIFANASGKQAFAELLSYKHYPSFSELMPRAALITSSVVSILLSLLLVSVTVQGLILSDWLIILSFVISGHIILFYTGYISELAKLLPAIESTEGDKIVAGGLAAAILLTIIAIIMNGSISAYLSVPLILAIGAGAVAFIFLASSHFRKEV